MFGRLFDTAIPAQLESNITMLCLLVHFVHHRKAEAGMSERKAIVQIITERQERTILLRSVYFNRSRVHFIKSDYNPSTSEKSLAFQAANVIQS